MLWEKIYAEFFSFSGYLESNKLSFLACESETSYKLLSKWINGLLWQKVEIMSSLFAVVVTEWNELWLCASLAFLAEVHHLRERWPLVCYEEQVCNIIVVNPHHLWIRVKLCMGQWFAPVSWIKYHILTIIWITCSNGNLQSMSAFPGHTLSFGAHMSILDSHWGFLSWINDMKLSLFCEQCYERTIMVPWHTPWQLFVALIIEHRLLHLHVPNANSSSLSCRSKCHVSAWMPLQEHDFLGVSMHHGIAFFDVSSLWSIWNWPQSQRRVGWCSCQ